MKKELELTVAGECELSTKFVEDMCIVLKTCLNKDYTPVEGEPMFVKDERGNKQKLTKLLAKLTEDDLELVRFVFEMPNNAALLAMLGEKLSTKSRKQKIIVSNDLSEIINCSMNTTGWDSCFKLGGMYHATTYALKDIGACVVYGTDSQGKKIWRFFVLGITKDGKGVLPWSKSATSVLVFKTYGKLTKTAKEAVVRLITKQNPVTTEDTMYLPYTEKVSSKVYADPINMYVGERPMCMPAMTKVYDVRRGCWRSHNLGDFIAARSSS